MKKHPPYMVLVATLGRTPQVLCETIWALANQNPPIIPDKVIAISMGNFVAEARRSIFAEGGGWKLLLSNLRRAKVKIQGKLQFKDITIATDPIGPIDDLRSVKDNERCANYLFDLVRKYTDSPRSVRIVFSLSGGRKSLSAIATSVMSLLARSDDMLVHLIANSEFEDGEYHFPRGGIGYSLFEVPFVRTRGLIQGVRISSVDTFGECRALTQERLLGVKDYPLLTLDASDASLIAGRCDAQAVRSIDGSRFMFLWLLFKMKSLDPDRFIKLMCRAHALTGIVGAPGWFRRFQGKVDKFLDATQQDSARNFSKVKQETMRDVIRKCGLTELQAQALYPRMKNGKPIPFEFGIDYSADRLVIRDTEFTQQLEQLLLMPNA